VLCADGAHPQCMSKCEPVKKVVCVYARSHENQDRRLRARYIRLGGHEVVSVRPSHR
jgi:hypothetical protein